MRAFGDWSIKTKMLFLSLVSAGMALACSAVGVTVNEFHTMRAFKSEALQTQARMLAFNCAGALSFGDPAAAKQLLASLKAQPSVEFACLYDAKGRVLATYPDDARTGDVPPAFDVDNCRISRSGDLEVFHRVRDRGDDLGGLYLRANTDDLGRQLASYGKILTAVVFAGLAISLLFAGQLARNISNPLQRVGRIATQITSGGDYSVRVDHDSADELGILCIQFNRMLDRVAASEVALKKAHDELERRVRERTAELHDSENYLKAILDTLPVGVFLIDAETHTVIDANPVACQMIDAKIESVVGAICHRFIYPANQGRRSDSDLGTTAGNTEPILMKTNGERIPVLKTEVPLMVRGRRHLLEVFVDITERKRFESEILRARDAAEAASVAKSRFLANMSHEIRTPLNAIIGFADILHKHAACCGDAECEDFLDTIHASGKHLLDLINDILDLSKIEADRLDVEAVRCSPHQIISEVISVLRVRALEKGLKLNYAWCSGVPETISTDDARFRQLMMNLVGNAIKFTNSGEVRIVADLVREPSNPHLLIQVIDTGVGIPADQFEAIFDPFVQADTSVTRQFGGTGLGLTISRRIARALGGDIAISSEPGKGSTFTVSLATGPLDDVPIVNSSMADGLRVAAQPSQEPLPSLAGVRVLLVEDGDTNRKLVSLVLRRAGADVATAENGQLGVELARKNPFDLVLMDMQMPVMDGYAATTRLRQEGLTLPILALTAHAMKGDESKCQTAGCSGYITKPIDGDELVRTVARILGRGPSDPAGVDSANASVEVASASCSDPPSCDATSLDASSPAGGALLSTLDTEDADFREIVLEFAERLHEKLDAMRRAHQAGDFQELACLAHWLKGAGGTAGFPLFTEPARRLESLARNQQHDEVEVAVTKLAELAQRITVLPTPPSAARG